MKKKPKAIAKIKSHMDGHQYTHFEDGSVGHLDCEKCDKDKKGKSTKPDNKEL